MSDESQLSVNDQREQASKQVLSRLADDHRYFIESTLSIVDMNSHLVPFIFNPAQDAYWKTITPRDIILKSRKLGFSVLRMARMFAKCATMEHRRCVIVSHEEKATQRLLGKLKQIIDSCVLKIPTGRPSKDGIPFPATKSSLWIGTAGQRAFSRGDDITDYLLSELAYYRDPSMITGLEEACVRESEGCIETTANGYGTVFHQMWLRASKKEKVVDVPGGAPMFYRPYFAP